MLGIQLLGSCSTNPSALGNPYHIDWLPQSYCCQNSASCVTSYSSCIGTYIAGAGAITATGQGSCSGSTKGCFSGSEVVTLESGDSKSISQIEVGDRILTANLEGKFDFSEVVFVPHGKNYDMTDFSNIVTSTGREIKLTRNHLIFNGDCTSDTPYELIEANAVLKGSCIQTIEGREEVMINTQVSGYGLYTAVTKDEFIVVNGIVASPFSVNHAVAHTYYNIHRVLYDVAPTLLSSKFIQKTNEDLGSLVMKMI